MQQVKDTVKIIFFIVWTLVGVALLVFMYKSYDMMGSLGGPRGVGGDQMMNQQNSDLPAKGEGFQEMMGENQTPAEGGQQGQGKQMMEKTQN